MTSETTGLERLARCGACRGRIKVPSSARAAGCPLCGLALLNAPGFDELPPIVVPRAGHDACWKALCDELRLPLEADATVLRRARLLLAPFWRHVDESQRSAARAGHLRSAADLSPVGLPSITAAREAVRGLMVETFTRTGDAMGRLDHAAGPLDADVVDVTLPPPEAPARAATAQGGAPPGWQLVYYPVWSFHYVVYNKEHYHVVDAVTARPVGPARRLRSGLVALASMTPMAAFFLGLQPWIGPLAAIPAWLAGLACLRLTLRAQRGS